MAAETIDAFFNKLDSRKTLLTTITDLHKTLNTHLTTIEETLRSKSETLDAQVKAFNERTEKYLEKLQNRENVLPELESSLTVLISEKKEAALAEIEQNKDADLSEKDPAEVMKIHAMRMDPSSFVRFLQSKRKECATLKPEIAAGLACAVDPMRLILDAVQEFVRMRVDGKLRMAERRWACDLLIQAAVPVVDGDYGAGKSLKLRAAKVLEKFRVALGRGERNSGTGAAEATLFLQFVIAFALKDRCQGNFLKKLVIEFASRKDMPKHAFALFGDKIGDIIDELVKNGKEIDAAYFASAAGLTERYPVLSLVKSHLRSSLRNANSLSKRGRFRPGAVDKATSTELEASKAVIKCVVDHNLEAEFPLEGLEKRVTELEEEKAEKRKSGGGDRSAPPGRDRRRGRDRGRDRDRDRRRDRRRRRRSSEPSASRPSKSARLSNPSPSHSRNPPAHVPLPVRYSAAPHSYPSQQIVYEAPSTVSYGPAYSGAPAQSPAAVAPQYGYGHQEAGAYGGAHAQSSAPHPQQYGYAVQEAGVGGARGYHGAYGAQSGYSTYDYSLAPPGTAYPPAYPQQ